MAEMILTPMPESDRELIALASDLIRRLRRPDPSRPVDLTPNGIETALMAKVVARMSDAVYDWNVAGNALKVYSREEFWTTVLPNTSASEDKGATARWAQSLMDPV